MTLIKSISGIRGTIGGLQGDALTPPDLLKFTAAYATRIKSLYPKDRHKVIVGRDARLSGTMVNHLVCGTLASCGIDVVDAGLTTTPTVEMAVGFEGADGGIILTASHNPREWNALKLLNHLGEFLSAREGSDLLEIAAKEDFHFVAVDQLGIYSKKDFIQQHIEAVLNHPFVDVEVIYRSGFKIVLDAVNSVGGIAIPQLLENLGVACVPLYCDPTGDFAHNPEPLPEHLTELSKLVVAEKADLGISVDPDVDRLALVCEDGSMFGEEYTLVAVADYILGLRKGAVVSNLASSRALTDVAERHGCVRFTSAVGEVNVVTEMKLHHAVIGGEGNGGVIFPDLHYGRDALIGIALFLTHLALKKQNCSQLRDSYPKYYMAKKKVDLTKGYNTQDLFDRLKIAYKGQKVSDVDGIKIDFEAEKKWASLRTSNTEPIIRVYTEAASMAEAEALAQELINRITNS